MPRQPRYCKNGRKLKTTVQGMGRLVSRVIFKSGDLPVMECEIFGVKVAHVRGLLELVLICTSLDEPKYMI